MATTPNEKGRSSGKRATPTTQRNDTPRGNSAAAQRDRLMRALKRGPIDTVHAYRQLDILHVPRRVFELRKMGYAITTQWVERITEAGEHHRVGLYSLEVGTC